MKDLITLLSKERLNSYENIEEHFDNLRLIARLTPKIATLEIILRNSLDDEMSKLDNKWIENSNDEKIIKELTKIKEREKTILNHSQYLSRLTLGIVIYKIRKERLQEKIINLKKIKFKKYDDSNRDYFYFSNGKRSTFNNFDKVDISLSFLHTLRNRSYHWENILKLRYENNKVFPRLTTKTKNTLIGLSPQRIETFLDDLIKCFNKDLIKMCLF
ncbi:MAG: hypothetical protein Q4A76_04695 [Porphyromonadaceae bacterium]|nr:hypothetical protein [Porphyromonadaceae bacterium]